MNWPAYQEVTNSGVEWIGNAPASWQVLRFAHLVDRANAGEVIDKNWWGGGEELLFTCAREPVASDFSPFPAVKRTTDRDILITRNATPYIHLPPAGSIYSNVVQRVSLREKVDRYWARYALEAASASMHGYGVSIDTLNFGMWRALRLPVPPLDEQQAIAGFLDRETAKIDALIGKQEELVATLREDRTATITHAVSKGLDPGVELIDSDDNWLDDIPRHWVRARLRDIIVSIDSGTSVNGTDAPAGPGDVGVLKTSCVSAGWFNPRANKTVVPEELSRVSCPVRAGTVIVNRANTPDLVGSAGFVRENVPDLYLSDLLWALFVWGVDPRFLHLWMQTPVYRTQVAAWRVGTSASMQKLSKSSLRSFVIALPPEKEQREVIDFLTVRTAKIDSLITKAIEVIEMLREYRSALITDAVTGKIDVREAVA